MELREILVNKYRARMIVEGIFVLLPSLAVLIISIMIGTHSFAVRQPAVSGVYVFVSISYFVMAITFIVTIVMAWSDVIVSPVMIVGCTCYIASVCVSTPYAYLKVTGIGYQILGYAIGVIWIIVCLVGLYRFSEDIDQTIKNYYTQIFNEERKRQLEILRQQRIAAEQEKQRRREERERYRYYNEKTTGELTEAEERIMHNLSVTKNARGLSAYGLANLLVPNKTGGTGTTQLDILEVNQDGIFIIESKDYYANISGKINDKGWIRENDGEMESFHNPIGQNAGHIRNIKALLAEQGVENVPFYSVIVFSNRGDISDVEKSFPNGVVCYEGEIRDALDKLGKKTKDKIPSNVAARIYKILKPYRLATQAERDKHVEQIEKKYADKSRLSMDGYESNGDNTY